MDKQEKILIISPEVYPQVKVGGLGMVVAGITNEINKRQVDFKVVSPDRNIYQPLWVESSKQDYYQLGKRAADICQNEDWQPDVVWTHDWGGVWSLEGYKSKNHLQGDPSATRRGREIRKHLGGESRFIWTVHSPIGDEYSYNYGYGGYGYGGYGYGWQEEGDEPIDWGDSFFDFASLIDDGISQADVVATVSQGYSRRLNQHPLFGSAESIAGVENGLDFDSWNPEKDRLIDFRLKGSWLEFKSRNKKAVQRRFNLPAVDVPVYCFVSRVVPQKGVDLLLKTLPEFISKNEVQFVFVGSGRKNLEDRIMKLEEEFPRKVGTKIEADFELPHQVYAGSDFLVLPSVAEPFGLVVAEAKKYRVTPIVHLIDGIKDQVADGQNGFGFYNYSRVELEKKLNQSLSFWQSGGFKQQLDRARRVSSWQKSVDNWLKLFKETGFGYGQA